MRPCSGRWSLKPSRHWIFQVCSELAATATSAPFRQAAPRMMIASLSSPCRGPREASRVELVSLRRWWFNVSACFPVACLLELWGMCDCLFSGVNLLGEMVRQLVEEGFSCQPVTAYLDKSPHSLQLLATIASVFLLHRYLFAFDFTFFAETFYFSTTLSWRLHTYLQKQTHMGHGFVHALCCLSCPSCLCISSIPPPSPV